MSYQAVASDMLATACAAIKNSLDGLTEMCGNTTINVGFVTFDSAVHFYQLREGHPARQLVVGEVDEPFLPVPSTLLVNLVDARSAVEAFLDALPAAHAASRNVETCTGNALQFAQLLLQERRQVLRARRQRRERHQWRQWLLRVEAAHTRRGLRERAL